MSAESTGSRGFAYWRLRFRAWRGNRPFWGGLLTMLGGVPIAYLPYADMRLGNMTIAMSTTAGAGSLIIGVLLITLGLTMWFHAIVRVFAGVAAIVLALVSLPVANIGGFLAGFLCALIGGALSVSWVPGEPVAEEATDAAGLPEGGEKVFPSADERADALSAAVSPRTNANDTTIDANGGRNSAG
ncbi:DUF6114 domain-containing protein [Streptomyces gobitricini]|uniref:DUF6114 domain-containing protein n=1 Tax=Streptomyces gobitricini TaxID=68211 RepID=A0ABN3MR02_9ACTN